MDFSIFYRLKLKKTWWVDVVFYFIVSLLISTVFCYLIFFLKIYLQKKEISDLDAKMETVGTDIQKDQEKTVFSYQKKINDYASLLSGHKFASNIFGFLEKDTLPDVWFSRFNEVVSKYQIDILGEAENLDALSRQTAVFEKNEFVKKVNVLGSSMGEMGKVEFNLSLALDPKIYNYVPPPPSENPPQENNNAAPSPEQAGSDKFITSFDLPIEPEVVGTINQTNHTITLAVPPGTDLKSLAPRINLSPNATVLPESDSAQDFTSPVVYTVKAQDGSTQIYTVTVSAALPASAETSNPKTGAIVWAVIIILFVAAGIAIFFFLKKRREKTTVDMSKITRTYAD